jgi:hypothetical protein
MPGSNFCCRVFYGMGVLTTEDTKNFHKGHKEFFIDSG